MFFRKRTRLFASAPRKNVKNMCGISLCIIHFNFKVKNLGTVSIYLEYSEYLRLSLFSVLGNSPLKMIKDKKKRPSRDQSEPTALRASI